MCTINEDLMIYRSWNIRCDRQEFLSLWAIFLPFQPPDNPENQNFKIKRNTGDIIILHIWTINDNHMMYGSWDMEHDRQIFFVILDHFTLYRPRKSKFWKNEKNPEDIVILQMCTINGNHMTDRIFCHFGPFF